MDIIKIEQLEVYGYHGVFEEEKKQGQPFIINVEMKTDFLRAAREDDLNYSTHYGEVCLFIKDIFTVRSYDLIETAAVAVAEGILQKFPRIREVELEVQKPKAPIPMKFSTVSVKVNRSWHKVYCSFGSNMGDKEQYIKEAMEKIQNNEAFRKLNQSSFYDSKAYGGVEQGDYLNGVFFAETYLSPYELLGYLHQLEAEAQRVRTIRWGPRTLDIDILLYDQLILDEKDLQIPHKDMANRDFVLIPLKEIAGHVRHPLFHKTIEEMAGELKENYIV